MEKSRTGVRKRESLCGQGDRSGAVAIPSQARTEMDDHEGEPLFPFALPGSLRIGCRMDHQQSSSNYLVGHGDDPSHRYLLLVAGWGSDGTRSSYAWGKNGHRRRP